MTTMTVPGGTITDEGTFRSMTDEGVVDMPLWKAVSASDGDSFTFHSLSTARHWLHLINEVVESKARRAGMMAA